jgi:hypothetical protein
MSKITLLSSKIQLTKKYLRNKDGSYDVEPYPLVKNVSSHERVYDTLADLRDIIGAAANNGYCLLKGHLDRQLDNESRQGHTSSLEPTDLLVLDYDESTGFTGPAELLAAIDPALEAVSYIWQPSASTAIHPNPIRGHAFIRLARPLSPASIKEWVIKLNLTIPELKNRIRLSKNGMSLCYPLDITVNQNDKLIYIAPPTCVDFNDPNDGNRVTLTKREYEYYDLDPSINRQKNEEVAQELMLQLQEESGIKRRPPKYRIVSGEELLLNPAKCHVTSEKDCGAYVRLNLNGGDSFAYWYHKSNPEILWNFKGEPPVFLKSIAPSYWAERIENPVIEVEGARPIVFRDIATDQYFNGVINPATQEILRMDPTSSKEKLYDFLAQYNTPKPEFIEDWTYEFDPQTNKQIDAERHWLNAFSPTVYMTMKEPIMKVPPTIEKVIRHICVTDAHYDHFINWLACVFQYRQRTQTAWMFHGVQGTGKGTLFHQILKPLFGTRHTYIAENDNLEDQFNSFLENKLVLFVDESDSAGHSNAKKVMARLKTWITEPEIPIRGMRRIAINRPNFLNIIVASNQQTPIRVEETDRRWNICPRQNNSIDLTADFDNIEGELILFANFLNTVKVDVNRARTPIRSIARDEMIELSRTASESFFHALRANDPEFFLDFITPNPPLPATEYYDFENVVKRWLAAEGHAVETSNRELMAVYRYISGKRDLTEKTFGWLMKTNGFNPERKRVDGERGRWVAVKINKPDDAPDFNEPPNNVLDFKRPV